jgi:hypothetical protein
MAHSRNQSVLLIDGYNVIGAWSDLHPLNDVSDRQSPGQSSQPWYYSQPEDLQTARNKLIEVLINYSSFEGYNTCIVFDAHQRDTPSYSEVISANLSVHYTDYQQTADSYIERYCALFRTERYRGDRLIVVTSDRAQKLTVVGYGAEWISSQQLVSQVEASALREKRKHRSKQKSDGRFLINSLDPNVRERLKDLRQTLQDKGK